MARARNIKPGIFKNEVLGVADPLLTLLFEGLWVLADREGRLEDRPLRIRAEIFPYRDGIDMDAMLNWLQSSGFIRRYESQGKRCILVLGFVKHQNPHKNEPESALPASEEIGTTPEVIGSARADSLSTDSLIPETATPAPAPPPRPAKARNAYTEEFEAAWNVYPSRPGNSKVDAFKAWNARISEGATHDAMTRGAAAYAAYIKTMQTDPKYVKQAETFFGPARHFESDWTPSSATKSAFAPPLTTPAKHDVDPTLARLMAEDARLADPAIKAAADAARLAAMAKHKGLPREGLPLDSENATQRIFPASENNAHVP